MANFDSGVSGYVETVAKVHVSFPVDWKGNADISCKRCPMFYRRTETCLLTHEIVPFPNQFVGEFCPLELKEELKERIEEDG